VKNYVTTVIEKNIMQIIRPISLNSGEIAIIDEEDYEKVKQYKWSFNGRYAIGYGKGIKNTTTMQRIVMNPPDGCVVDHINRDKLDNRRSNLRICTQSQNMANYPMHGLNTSGRKGVYWNKKREKWRAQIRFNQKLIVIGYFHDLNEASEAYIAQAKKLFGEFAYEAKG
jgi:hypothetical protein